MRNKRIIIVGYISIVLIGMLFIKNTYSMFVSEDADPNTNVYTTGNLDISYEVSSKIKFTDSYPVNDKDAMHLEPYRIKVTNSGNVDYKFNLIIDDTTATDVIDYKYIMVKIGKHKAFSLDTVSKNVIYKDIIIKDNSRVDIDVRIYISDKIPNSEVGKNFSAKLSINGVAVIYDEGDIDNSDLISNYQSLTNVNIGSYVKFEEDKCNNSNCKGYSANYVDSNNLGYCFNINYKYKSNGWRLAYIDNNIPYLISAGSVDCIDNSNFDNYNILINNLNQRSLSYCNSNYSFDARCDNKTIWGFNSNDFVNITFKDINNCLNSNDIDCGFSNDLINNGGYYWILGNTLNQYYWDPSNNIVGGTSKYNQGYGLRVVMKLREDLYVLSGSGTETNPYIISNKEENS